MKVLLVPIVSVLLWAPQSGPEVYQKLEATLLQAKSAKIRCKMEIHAAGQEKVIGRFDATLLFKEGRSCLIMTSTDGTRENTISMVVDHGRMRARLNGGSEESTDVDPDYAATLQRVFVRGGLLMTIGFTFPESRPKLRSPKTALEVTDVVVRPDAKSVTYKLHAKEDVLQRELGETLTASLSFDPADHTLTERTFSAKGPTKGPMTITEHYVVVLNQDLPDKLFRVHDADEFAKPPKPGGFKPSDCIDTQLPLDPTEVKVGQWLQYRSEAGKSLIRQTTRIVGKDGDKAWVEYWMDMESMKYGYLFQIGAEKRILKAWAAAAGDKGWTSIQVRPGPKPLPGGLAPEIKESDEKREVPAGAFDCRRLDVSVNIQGKEYRSSTWYSKDVWKFQQGREQGGLVAMEASGAKILLEARGEDAKPTLPLPRE